MLANHGRIEKYNHLIEGYNSRLDGLQAAILSVKLKYLDEWTEKRREIAYLYNELLENTDVITPKELSGTKCVYHLYVIRIKERDELRKFLKEKGISTGIHYPTGLPFLHAYKHLHSKPDDLPVTYKYQNEILSLPIYPELKENEIHYIVNIIKEFFE